MSIKVQLSMEEIRKAAGIGVARQVQNIERGRKPRYGAGKSNDWQLHIEGCLAEYAVAKLFGVTDYDGKVGDLSPGDVGRLEVRSSAYFKAQLVVHPEDSEDSAFILVRGNNGSYWIEGWMLGRDAKKKEYWKEIHNNGRPAYFVDYFELKDIKILLEKVHEYVF